MTTYTLNGLLQTWQDTDGDGEDDTTTWGVASLVIVAPDAENSFTYTVTNPGSEGFSDIDISGLNSYHIFLNGIPLDGPNATVGIGEVHHGAGQVSQILSIGYGNGVNHVFRIGGDPMPIFTTHAAFESWAASVTQFGPVTVAGLLPGNTIPLAGLSGVTTSENDVVTGNWEGNLFVSGAGDDSVEGNAGYDTVYGGNGNDTINGGTGQDQLFGGNDNDVIHGGDHDDTVGGGAGNDMVFGDDGHDQVWGAAGNDTLDGGNGNDTVGGGAGNDVMSGGWGNDTMWGGSNDDWMGGGAGNDEMSGGWGNDTMLGGAGSDTLWGSNGNDTLRGGDHDDLLGGGSQNDYLEGNSGNDTLLGSWGSDMLNGGWGNDSLNGGVGDDMLIGNNGADVFVFNDGFGVDQINDFNLAEDRLRLDDALWTSTHGTLTAAEVVSTFGSTAGGYLTLNFGAGELITLIGITSTVGMDGVIDIF